MDNILLLGSTLTNNNRGCNALTLGGICLICNKYKECNITILQIDKTEHQTVDTLSFKNKSVRVKTQYILGKRSYYYAFIDLLKYFITGKTNNELILHISKSDIVYTINAGDGFTDIYGIKRLLQVFIEFIITFLLKKKISAFASNNRAV